MISTCPLKNVTNTPEGESVCCGTTGCTEAGLTSVVGHRFAAGLEPDTCEICGKTKWTSRNVLPREQSEPCLFSSGHGKASEHAVMISSFPVPAVGGTSESALISSGPLRNASNMLESSGESHGTETRTVQRTSSDELSDVTRANIVVPARASNLKPGVVAV